MILRPPRPTLTYTLFPYTTLFRSFVVLVECSVQLDCFAVVAVGPQFLAEPAGVLRNQAVGGAEDGAGRAVVLFEADRLAAAEILVETQHVVDARAAPAVDRLVVIADREQHAAVAGERAQPVVLQLVGVLELVDEDVAKTDRKSTR